MLLNPLNRRVRERHGFPVFPGAFPVIGHMPAMMTDAIGLMRRAQRQLGDFFWMKSGFGQPSLYCLHPDVFTIFKNKVTTSTYLQEIASDFLGRSLLVHDGAVHHHMRSAMNGPFLPPGLTAAETGAVLADLIEKGVRGWAAKGEVRILAETREVALAAIFRVMGIPEEDLPSWRRNYEHFVMLALNLPNLPGSPRRRGLRAKRWLSEHLMVFIREARAHPEITGLLASLVHARDEEGSGLTDEELIDNLRLLVLAGHETSASTLAWMTVVLAQRTDLWERLCAEATAAGAVPRTPRELKNFPFAEALFRETLRLYPPVSTDARRALVDFELGGRTVPAGTQISISIAHLSRHAAVYERPDEFLPERWLGRAEAITPLELVQFGGGPHFCLGYHLAWMEIVQSAVALALVMRGRGVRPHLMGSFPARRYLPLLHPAAGTRVRFS
jgi:cytochrome P450